MRQGDQLFNNKIKIASVDQHKEHSKVQLRRDKTIASYILRVKHHATKILYNYVERSKISTYGKSNTSRRRSLENTLY